MILTYCHSPVSLILNHLSLSLPYQASHAPNTVPTCPYPFLTPYSHGIILLLRKPRRGGGGSGDAYFYNKNDRKLGLRRGGKGV